MGQLSPPTGAAIGVGAGAQTAVHVGERALLGADDFGGLLTPTLPPEVQAVTEEPDSVGDVGLVAENVVPKLDDRSFHPLSVLTTGWSGLPESRAALIDRGSDAAIFLPRQCPAPVRRSFVRRWTVRRRCPDRRRALARLGSAARIVKSFQPERERWSRQPPASEARSPERQVGIGSVSVLVRSTWPAP